jgi:hypothetical protein
MKYLLFTLLVLVGCSVPNSTSVESLASSSPSPSPAPSCLPARSVVLGCGCHGRVSFSAPLRSPICCSGFSRVEGCMGLCDNGEVPWMSHCTQ